MFRASCPTFSSAWHAKRHLFRAESCSCGGCALSLIRILDSPIAFQRSLVSVTGTVTGALLLSQSIYHQNRCQSDDGWWPRTQKEWEDETGMKRTEFLSARKSCFAVLKHRVRGVPATCEYRIDEARLQTSLLETCKLDCLKPANKNAHNLQTPNIETISESTTREKVQFASQQEAFPESLKTPEFEEAWKNWLADRKERKKTLSSRAASIHLKKCEGFGPEKAIKSIEASIEHGWAGLFEPKEERSFSRHSEKKTHERPPVPEGEIRRNQW